jgi:hypothetical protein
LLLSVPEDVKIILALPELASLAMFSRAVSANPRALRPKECKEEALRGNLRNSSIAASVELLKAEVALLSI